MTEQPEFLKTKALGYLETFYKADHSSWMFTRQSEIPVHIKKSSMTLAQAIVASAKAQVPPARPKRQVVMGDMLRAKEIADARADYERMARGLRPRFR
jgi:hypothetical protein